jgi:hypothetical protein
MEEEHQVMKRIRLLVLLGAVAVALPLGLTTAKASGSTSTSSVTIHEQADYDAAGLVLDVGLNVRCYGGVNGLVDVMVEQYPPETPYPVAFGSGPQSVVCDGKSHTVGVTIVGEGFDAGRAQATATLIVPMKPTVTAKRWITIVEV